MSLEKVNELIEEYVEELEGEDELLEQEDREKPGGSNVGQYKPSEGPFCGPAGGAPKGTYPVGTRKRAQAALAYARNAPNPEGIKKCVYRHWPDFPGAKKDHAAIPSSKIKIDHDKESLKFKDVREEWPEAMCDLAEGSIDVENRVIKGVCVFGRARSDNGYTYQEKAIGKLATLVNGANVYINHPSKAEFKDRDGVRDIRDWAGVYENAKRHGEKIFADLRVREAYFPLVKDIALMKPAKVGNSINSRVRVFTDDVGQESVVDIDRLHSVDLVASGATIDNLWESTQENLDCEEEKLCEEALALLKAKLPVLLDELKESILTEDEDKKAGILKILENFDDGFEYKEQETEEPKVIDFKTFKFLEFDLDNITLPGEDLPEELQNIEID